MTSDTHPFQAEFDRLYLAKNATAALLERVFKPKKYPDFHAYLDWLHERWITSQRRAAVE